MTTPDGPNTPDTFDEAERFQRLFVRPLVDAVRAEMQSSLQPLIENGERREARIRSIEDRTLRLEQTQSRALLGWGVFAAGLSIALTAIWDYLKGLFFGR